MTSIVAGPIAGAYGHPAKYLAPSCFIGRAVDAHAPSQPTIAGQIGLDLVIARSSPDAVRPPN
jgi:hypothetical protein